jgi:hypothetical protein
MSNDSPLIAGDVDDMLSESVAEADDDVRLADVDMGGTALVSEQELETLKPLPRLNGGNAPEGGVGRL